MNHSMKPKRQGLLRALRISLLVIGVLWWGGQGAPGAAKPDADEAPASGKKVSITPKMKKLHTLTPVLKKDGQPAAETQKTDEQPYAPPATTATPAPATVVPVTKKTSPLIATPAVVDEEPAPTPTPRPRVAKARPTPDAAAVAEAERKRQAAEEKLAEEKRVAEKKAEEDRLAKQEVERQLAAAKKAETERLAMQEEERKVATAKKAETERLAKQEEERKVAAAKKAEEERQRLAAASAKAAASQQAKRDTAKSESEDSQKVVAVKRPKGKKKAPAKPPVAVARKTEDETPKAQDEDAPKKEVTPPPKAVAVKTEEPAKEVATKDEEPEKKVAVAKPVDNARVEPKPTPEPSRPDSEKEAREAAQRGDFQEAAKQWAALRGEKTEPRLLHAEAAALAAQSEYQRSEKLWAQLESAGAGVTPELRAEALLSQALAAELQGRREPAQSTLRRLLRDFPSSPQAALAQRRLADLKDPIIPD